jgi:hypothetical protein
VLCVAVCALWVRSYFKMDEVVRTWSGSRRAAADKRYLVWVRRLTATSTRGKVVLDPEYFDWDTDEVLRISHLPPTEWNWSSTAKQPGAQALSPPPSAQIAWASQKTFGWNWMWISIQREMVVRDPPGRGSNNTSYQGVEVIALVPCWFLLPPLALLPGTWLRGRIRRRRRRTLGLCLKCGFDLRVTPDRCPECGAVPATTPSSS